LGAVRELLKRAGDWALGLTSTLGGFGLFIVAFLDSSFISLPIANDIVVIQLSIRHKAGMPFYALMALLGSIAGCLVLYFLARKGGEAYFRRRAGARAERVRKWVERNAFLSIAIPSILPPPMPFKAFVLAAGVFQMPLRTFLLALVTGRGLRYFAEGFLAVRYGEEAIEMLKRHPVGFSVAMLTLIVGGFYLTRKVFGARRGK
jgi:membrane protein YqaA with SNARE-associated domain